MNSEKKQLMFAPGWFQEISTTSEEDEKRDLIIYLDDAHKALHGVRCRGLYTMEDSIEDLRMASKGMEEDIYLEMEWERKQAHERMLEANKHALAVRRAKKALPKTFKPFANLMEII